MTGLACPRCGEDTRPPRQSYCRPCKAAYEQARRYRLHGAPLDRRTPWCPACRPTLVAKVPAGNYCRDHANAYSRRQWAARRIKAGKAAPHSVYGSRLCVCRQRLRPGGANRYCADCDRAYRRKRRLGLKRGTWVPWAKARGEAATSVGAPDLDWLRPPLVAVRVPGWVSERGNPLH